MPIKSTTAALGLAATALLGACATPSGVTRVHTVLIYHGYSPYEVARLGAVAPLNVVGTPADGAAPEAAAAVMRLPARFGGRPFEVSTDQTGLRFVLSYAPASSQALCAGEGPTGAHDPLNGAIAFCHNDEPLSGAMFDQSDLRGPGDPGFALAAQRALTAILPPYNPNQPRRRRFR